MTLDTQLHLYSDTFIEEVRPIENDESILLINLPKPGTGLWTSTWNAETRSSAWADWWNDENFGAPYEQSWVLLTPKQDARIFVIDSVEDLDTLLRRYHRVTGQKHQRDTIDFQLLATEYDALHLTEKGRWSTTLSILDAVLRKYRRVTEQQHQHNAINFQPLATEYDALHLTEGGQWATRLSIPYNLCGWDSESTVWFRWCFERIEHIAVPPMRLPHVVE